MIANLVGIVLTVASNLCLVVSREISVAASVWYQTDRWMFCLPACAANVQEKSQ